MHCECGDGAFARSTNQLLTTRFEMQELDEGARYEHHDVVTNQM